ncbi:HTH-type transcriptional regulator GltC [Clostridium ragsdalei P11]|uniref:HTH-type transcriptional regulator GltC n=1 Tax=Clostridium ragsdalei P11 TaxID=1353534 RepID=A0A1A6AVX8_9CLOT|nr:LysR family transcriptional regulator [Clostridium ragsdalei]OBR94202.1 HTH-type transcriptional regulator GltC [Clostridium ragsdalei P11]
MDFHQLEYVIAIAEEKSFSKAAKKLYISQPSLSEYIMRLEKQLEVKLFDRSTSPLTLTFAGEKYIETAKNILNSKKRLMKELYDISDSKKGRITIGIPVPTERYILPLVLPQFYKKFPNVEIVIEGHSARQLEELLIVGKIDIAIMHLPTQDSRIVYEPISIERVFLIAPPGYNTEIEKRQKLDFTCLKNEKFILIKPGHRMRFIADELFKRAQFEPNILIEVRNIDTAYNLANSGMGFTLVPESVISFFNTNNYKNYFLIDDINFILAVAYRKGEYITKVCHEFIKITKEALVSKQGSVFSPLE